jgi:hypothetical protein
MENEQCDKLTMEQDEIADVTKNKSDFHLSLFSIIFTNLLLMAVALSAGLSITQLIWVYWCGGVFVGLFRALKVLSKVDSSDDKIEGGLAVFFLALSLLHNDFRIQSLDSTVAWDRRLNSLFPKHLFLTFYMESSFAE